jgi:hypothetical protein
MSNLTLFYNFYQACETPQRIDLSQSKDQYLLPCTHPEAQKIAEAAKDLDVHNSMRTKVTPLPEAQGLFQINKSPGWLIRGDRHSTRYSSIQEVFGPGSSKTLRVVMNHRLKKVVKEHQLPISIPDEYLVYAPDPQRKAGSKVNYKDFFVVSQRFNLLPTANCKVNPVQYMRTKDPQQQKAIATTICQLIYYSGFMDAHMENIGMQQNKQLTVVDTEGQALFCDATEEYSPISLSDARIVGLKEFIKACQDSRLPEMFIQTARKYLLFARLMKIVRIATILISVACPLIPLIVCIVSIASAKLHNGRAIAESNRHQTLPFMDV